MRTVAKPLRRAWTIRTWAVLALLVGVSLWTGRSALIDIWQIGTGRAEQSYILLAPFVAVWLFWLRRSRLRSLQIEFNLIGPALIALGWFSNFVGIERDIQIATHAGLLLTLLGCVVSLTGAGFVRQFAPALAAMLFVIPIPGTIRQLVAMPLQTLATSVTEIMLELIGVTVTRLGHVLIINGESVAVGEACSGLRMVFAFGVVVYAFAFSLPLRASTRIVLLALSPAVAILCNVVRLIPTSMFFGFGSINQAQVFHDLAGWVMIPIALVVLVGILRLIRWLDLPVMAFRLAMR